MQDDEAYRRRRHDDDPVTVGELARRFDRHERDSLTIHRDLQRLLSKIDERVDLIDDRTDHTNARVAVIFAVVAVLWAIFLVAAPLIRGMLGLPNAV